MCTNYAYMLLITGVIWHMYLTNLPVIPPLRVTSNNCWLWPTLKQLTTTVNTTAQTVTSPTRTYCKHRSPKRRLVWPFALTSRGNVFPAASSRPKVSGSLARCWYFWRYQSKDWTHRLVLYCCSPQLRIIFKLSKLWNNMQVQELCSGQKCYKSK